MHMRDSLLLTSLFVMAACPPATGTTTAGPGTTDDSSASTGEPGTGTTDTPTGGTTTGGPTTGDPSTGDPTTGTANTPPTAPVVAITPASPTRRDDLSCTVTTESTDADGDPISYAFSWTRDGADAGVASMTVPAAEIEVGEAWTCIVTPSDGIDDGPAGTAEATILPVCTSLEFDGVDDHVGSAHITAGTWTLEAWVLPGALPGQRAIISQIDSKTDPFRNFELGIEGGVPYVFAPDGKAWHKAAWDGPIAAGEWHHIAGMYDGAKVWIAVDGVIGPQVVPSVFAESNIPLMIGTRLNNNFYFEGAIFEVRVSSTARYAAPFDPPVGFTPDADTLRLWRLDEGLGTMCVDSSTSPNDGTIMGDAAWATMLCPDSGAKSLARTCAEVKAKDPGAVDGEYTLHVAKDANKPWTAYCHDMAGTPKEYLPLVNVQDGRNFSQYTASNPRHQDVVTRFTRVRIDPTSLIVDIDDLTFSSSTGMVLHGGPVTSMPYAVAEGCAGPGVVDGVGNIDLVGTPFKVVDPFCTKGANAAGKAVFSSNDQVVDLTGGGNCGWTGPTKGNDCVFDPQFKNSGFVLDLAYVLP